jgi:hypothetical protein
VPAAADERWAAVQAAWPGLPEHVKHAILLLVEAARVTAAAGK